LPPRIINGARRWPRSRSPSASKRCDHRHDERASRTPCAVVDRAARVATRARDAHQALHVRHPADRALPPPRPAQL